jgi:hypothetical protein
MNGLKNTIKATGTGIYTTNPIGIVKKQFSKFVGKDKRSIRSDFKDLSKLLETMPANLDWEELERQEEYHLI